MTLNAADYAAAIAELDEAQLADIASRVATSPRVVIEFGGDGERIEADYTQYHRCASQLNVLVSWTSAGLRPVWAAARRYTSASPTAATALRRAGEALCIPGVPLDVVETLVSPVAAAVPAVAELWRSAHDRHAPEF